MGVTIAVTRVACNTSTGTQDITTPDLGGLTPKAAILIATRGVTDGAAADGAGWYIGITDGTRQVAHSFEDQHAQASSDVKADASITAALVIYDGTADGVLDGSAAFSAWITNGIRINWTDAPSSGWLLTVIFFAGSDLSVHANYKDLGTGTSIIDITDPGFEPDDVITYLGGGSHYQMGIGFVHNDRAGGVTQRYAGGRASTSSPNTANQAVAYDDACLALMGASAVTSKLVASAFDSSGFSVTPSASFSSNRLLYLALRYGSSPVINSKVYTFTTPTSTGNNTDTGPNFEPQAVLYGLTLGEAINTYYTDAHAYSSGVAAITSGAQYCNVVTSEDSAADSNTQSLSDNQAINHPLHDGSAGLAATYVSMQSTGPQLNWSDIEAAGRIYIAIAFGTGGAAPQTVNLSAAGVATGGQALDVQPGEMSKALLAAVLTAAGQVISVDAGGIAPTTVNLLAASLASIGQVSDIQPGAMSKVLTAAALAAQGQTLDVQPGAISKALLAATLQALGQIITISAPSGLQVSLDAALLAAAGQTVDIQPGAVSKVLDAAGITASGQATTVTSGAVSIALDAGALAANGQTITLTPGAVSVLLQAAALAASGQDISVYLVWSIVASILIAGAAREIQIEGTSRRIQIKGSMRKTNG